jgi:hypothetical protein
MSQSKNIANFFKDKNYVIIKNLISAEMSFLFYEYIKTKVTAIDYKKTFDNKYYNQLWDGDFGDEQVNSAYWKYGDPLFDTLMKLIHSDIERDLDLKLNYNYSYLRFYTEGNDMKEHVDRESCEVSLSMCMGYDNSNVDTEKYPNYNWPMWLGHENSDDKLPISLEPGDALLYRGCNISHFRENLLGLNHAQVFMHYNETEGKFNNILDNRPVLGIPAHHSGSYDKIKKRKIK